MNVFTIEFAEVRSRWLALVAGTQKPWGRTLSRLLSQWQREGHWIGCTIEQMKGWLASGYTTEALSGAFAQYNRTSPRRKLRFDEEGELQADLAMSGFDQPFLQWERRPRKPGLAVNIELSSSGSTDAKVIAAYTTWVAQMLLRFETEGYDLEVNVTNTVRGLYGNRSEVDQTRVRVKRENEAADFTNWSAMFSPGGLRMLMFSAKCVGGEVKGMDVSSGLGGPIGTAYECTFDADTRTLTVMCPRTASEFPAADMTAQLERLGI